MRWKMNSGILGLTVATVSPGLSVVNGGPGTVTPERRNRALIEMAIIGSLSAHYTKSYWPLVGPFAYLAFDYAWAQAHNAVPKVGVTPNGG